MNGLLIVVMIGAAYWAWNFLFHMFGAGMERRVDSLSHSRVDQADIVFFGDSITQEGAWSEYFPNQNIVNRGVGGDTTTGLRDRLDDIVRLQPKRIFLAVGVNNLNGRQPPESVSRSYAKLLDAIAARLPQTEVVVQSVLPVNSSKSFITGATNSTIGELNALIEALCTERRLDYIDVFSKLIDSNGELRADLSNDGIHLKGQAYAIWIEVIAPHVTRPFVETQDMNQH